MGSVIVVGAGVTGVTTAYALQDRGHAVTLVERLRYPAMETSFANGGQLSASNAEVWNNRATVLKAMGWMLRRDAPLLFNPAPALDKYGWLAEFCGQIRHYRRNTLETVRLALAARRPLLDMIERENIDCDLTQRGILHLYYDKASFARARTANILLTQGGLERTALTPRELLAVEPALDPGRGYYGGFYTPSDSTGDIHKFTTQLADACVRRGARLRLSTEVNAIDTSGRGVRVVTTSMSGPREQEILEADALVICAGVGSRRLAAGLGERAPIYPVKGYSITVGLDDAASQAAAPTVSLLDEDAKIVTSRLGAGRFRVAGTAELNGANKDIRADRIAPLVRWCERLFPGMSMRSVTPWAGLRPMTPSMLPLVGPGRRPGIFYNTGHGHLGWTLSAATAQVSAAAVDRCLDGRRGAEAA